MPGPRYATKEEREQMFWSKVDIRGEDECWPWKASKMGRDEHGHGAFYNGHTVVRAQRFAYEATYGPTNLYVLHKCGNASCVNPKHLYAGTHGDNMRDGPSGRWPTFYSGEVFLMKRLRQHGLLYREIAPLFKTNRHAISRYCRGIVAGK